MKLFCHCCGRPARYTRDGAYFCGLHRLENITHLHDQGLSFWSSDYKRRDPDSRHERILRQAYGAERAALILAGRDERTNEDVRAWEGPRSLMTLARISINRPWTDEEIAHVLDRLGR